jgi:AcrR family transcriptional regulator
VPYPRFERLAAQKRARLLDEAAREFAAHGFDDASLNRILSRARMSKGAAYYYFEDKADVFSAVVLHCATELKLVDITLDPTVLDAKTFWPAMAALHREPLLRAVDRPWLFGALRAAGRLPLELREREPLASFARLLTNWVGGLIACGRTLGVIRADVPDELLFAWMEALDAASDAWLLVSWERLDRAAIARISDQTVEAMRGALGPAPPLWPLHHDSYDEGTEVNGTQRRDTSNMQDAESAEERGAER